MQKSKSSSFYRTNSALSCGRSLVWLGHQPATIILEDFRQFCLVDLQESEGTVKNNVYEVTRFLKYLTEARKRPVDITTQDVRNYLSRFTKGYSPNTYSNVLKSLKIFCRDFLDREDIVKTFRFPPRSIPVKVVPKREELQRFYYAIANLRGQTLFLLLATSGRRLKEAVFLDRTSIDLDNHMITPPQNSYASRTKRCWYSFFNQETKDILEKYLIEYKLNERLFPMKKRVAQKYFDKARRKTGLRITARTLRDWFCCEMGELGVPDRYIDAFCGRVPKSILARHYTDYSPERLKRIYDRANLKVLS